MGGRGLVTPWPDLRPEGDGDETAMYLLRLFHQSDPTRQVDSRTLEEGELVIGRDPPVGWRIDDPDRQLSRTHCTLRVRSGDLLIRDTSANGVTLGRSQTRLPRDEFVPLDPGESLSLGKFILTVERTTDDVFASDPTPSALDVDSSPFAPPSGGDMRGLSTPRAPDPFASELHRSPLDADPFSSGPFESRSRPERGVLPQSAEDVWDRHDASKVGDWNGPTAHRTAGHEALIGSASEWSEPEQTGPPEVGFGFDAPFHRPILRADPIPPEALLIPSDWDADPATTTASRPFPVVVPDFEALPPVAATPIAATPIAPTHIASAPFAELPYTSTPIASPPPAEPEPEPIAAQPFAQPQSSPASPPAPLPTAPIAALVERSQPANVAFAPASPGVVDEHLLRAFCEGARLDPSEFEGEDPIAVLQRAGAIYQQMILGLGDLLSERTSLKNEYRMARTTVAPEGNNPFKWAPARRVAVDLLRGSNEGFIAGPQAVRESFEDLKKHLLCLLAGMRASIASTLRALSPEAVKKQLKKPSFGLASNRGAAAWTEYGRLHAEFQHQADDNPDSQINRDFRAAYEQQLGELDGHDARP